MRKQWTCEQAWQWYNQRPWVMGVNYVPSITLHGYELWQEQTHEEVMACVRREIELMKDIGVNSVRTFLRFDAWYYDPKGFMERLNNYLDALNSAGITLMPVVFNDCLNFGRPEDITPKRPGGWHSYDIGHHGGAIKNPFTGEKKLIGWNLWDEPEWREPQENYLRDLLAHFGQDERIYAWDLWNEPGNSNRHDMSIPYLKRAFEIGREMDTLQPLTAGPFTFPKGYGVDPAVEVEPIARVALDESDIVTFHHYGGFERGKEIANKLAQEGRPMLNTEWLNRILDNQMADHLPYYHDERIGSYSWGLVAGKSQHFLPWDTLWNRRELPLNRWQHDLFDTYHTPYDPAELELMRRLSPVKK